MSSNDPKAPSIVLGPNATDPSDHSSQYWRQLVDCSYQNLVEPPFGEFARLQQLNLTHLLNELATIKAAIRNDGTTSRVQMDLLRRTLHEYADSIRDYSYINQLPRLPDAFALKQRISLEHAFPGIANPYPGRGGNVPYDTRYRTLQCTTPQKRDGVREVLRKWLPSRLSWSEEEIRARRSDYSHGMPPEIYSAFLDSLARFIIGTVGGMALVVPMLIMVFDTSLTKSLIVVSVALVLFSLALSLIFETDNKDTITATATYAAVLVVFVGTSAAGHA